MARCKDCIHYDVCKYRPLAIGVDICDVFRSTADVAPKTEVEKLIIDRNAARLGMIAEHERLKTAKAEVAIKIIDEFMSAMRVKHEKKRPKYGGALALLLPDIEQIATELKKKYLGSD